MATWGQRSTVQGESAVILCETVLTECPWPSWDCYKKEAGRALGSHTDRPRLTGEYTGWSGPEFHSERGSLIIIHLEAGSLWSP